MQESKNKWTVCELKLSYTPAQNPPTVLTPGMCYQVFNEIWDKELISIQEEFYVLFVNNASEVICWRKICTGTLHESTVDINLILAIALQCRATGIVVAHNHPSGDLEPSREDIKFTNKLIFQCEMFGFRLLDHLILGSISFSSMVEGGFIVHETVKYRTDYL